jgi:hypothetical protein
MFTAETLEELEQRKQALVAKSDVHRAMLELQVAQLRPYVEYVDTGVNLFRRARPLWKIGSPLLGLWAARRLTKVAGWVPSAFLGWKIIRKGMSLWRSFQQTNTPEDMAAPADGLHDPGFGEGAQR